MDTNRKLVIYVDWASQPARAVVALCRLNNIAHDVKEVRIFKKENHTAEYGKVNPIHKVPAIQEVDTRTGEVMLNLGESHAIMRYLATVHKVDDHWYPQSDFKQQARINEYLD